MMMSKASLSTASLSTATSLPIPPEKTLTDYYKSNAWQALTRAWCSFHCPPIDSITRTLLPQNLRHAARRFKWEIKKSNDPGFVRRAAHICWRSFHFRSTNVAHAARRTRAYLTGVKSWSGNASIVENGPYFTRWSRHPTVE